MPSQQKSGGGARDEEAKTETCWRGEKDSPSLRDWGTLV